MCERTGATERTVRYYVEREILLPQKTERGGREYLDFTERDVELLKAALTLREAELSLDEIKTIIDFPVRTRDIARDAGARLHARTVSGNETAQLLQTSDASDIFTLAAAISAPIPNKVNTVSPNAHMRWDDPDASEASRQEGIDAYERHERRRHIAGKILYIAAAAYSCFGALGALLKVQGMISFALAAFTVTAVVFYFISKSWARYVLGALAALDTVNCGIIIFKLTDYSGAYGVINEYGGGYIEQTNIIIYGAIAIMCVFLSLTAFMTWTLFFSRALGDYIYERETR